MIRYPEDLNHRGVLALEASGKIHILEAIAKCGNLFQSNLASIGTGNNGDVFVFRSIITATFGAYQYFTASCLNAAGRKVEAGPFYRISHLLQSKSIAPQSLFGDFDVYLLFTNTKDIS